MTKEPKNLNENESENTKAFIEKMSIKLYLTTTKLEQIGLENQKEKAEIIKEIKSIDKEILKHFNVKLTEATKKTALKYYDILK